MVSRSPLLWRMRFIFQQSATARPIIAGMVRALSRVSRATRLEAKDLSPS